MFTKEDLMKKKQAAELELSGLSKLAEAQELLKGGAMKVEGDPVPASPAGEVMLMLSDENKEASVAILNKVARDMDESDDAEIARQADEVRSIAEEFTKNAFVHVKDTVDPEPEVDQFFRDGVVEVPAEDRNSPAIKKLETDDTVEVYNFAKNPGPYQKL